MSAAAHHPVTSRGDALETEADRVAGHVLETGRAPDGFRRPGRAAGPASSPPSPLGPGAALDPDLRRAFAGVLGDGGGDVRVHTDAAAAQVAASYGARALTLGQHVAFGRGEYAPGTSSGRRLLAHELTHTVQARGRSAGPAMRQPHDPADPTGPAIGPFVSPGFLPPFDFLNPMLPTKVDLPTTVGVVGASLDPSRRRRERDVEQVVFSMPVEKVEDYRYYSVPVASVFATAQAARASRLPPPVIPRRTPTSPLAGTTSTVATTGPVVTPSTASVTPSVQNLTATHMTAAPAVELPPSAPHVAVPDLHGPPVFTTGSTVFTPDGVAHTVLGATVSSVVTSTYTKYAVGAGSTSLLKAGSSFVVIDAGVFGSVDAAVRNRTIAGIRAQVGPGGVIATVLITHAHADHMNLLPELAREFRIGSIRINALQADRPEFRAVLEQVRQAHRDRVTAEARSVGERLEGGRAAWEGADKGDPLTRRDRWHQHRDGVMRQALDAIPDIMLERIVPGVRGRLAITALPIDAALLAPPDPARIAPGERLAPGVRSPAVLDPAFQDELTRRAGAGPESKTLDRFSSSWVVDVKGHTRFIVMPDLRGEDMRNVLHDFRRATANLGMEARFQVWDVSHHMQIGWSGGGRTSPGSGASIRATQLGHITRFLHAFRAGTRTAPGTDVVVVSAYEGFGTTGRSYVDPANVFILKSLGYHVFLATANQDVRVLKVLTSQGKTVTGIVGAPQGGPAPTRELLRMAEATLAELRDRIRLQRQVLTRLKRGAADDPARATARAEIERLTRLNAEVDGLRLRYLDAVHDDMARSTRGTTPTAGTTPAAPPPPKEPAAGEALLQKLRTEGFERPVPTTGDPRFSEAALAIVSPEAIDRTAARDTPAGRALELVTARQRIREIESRAQGSVDPVKQRAELLAELFRYRYALEEQVRQPGATGPSRQVLDDELRTTRERIAALTPGENVTGVKRRMPVTGAMVETKVLSAERLQPATTTPGVDPAPKPTTGQRVGAAIEGVTTRGFGGLMVYQTITAEADVLARAGAGKASAEEVAATTAHTALGVTLGLKMLRGVPVRNGPFVVLSLLEIAQAASRDYASPDQRNTEIAYAALRGGVNLGLMAAGAFLMTVIPPPFGVLAGLAVGLLGDTILDALGAHDWVERMMSFQPRQVTKVEQELRDLVQQYEVIVGTIQLTRRSDESLRGVGATDVWRTRSAAGDVKQERLMKAYPLEKKILSAFSDAYDRAQTAFAGLQELDLMRKQFYDLMLRVHQDDDELMAFQRFRDRLLDRYRNNDGKVDRDRLNQALFAMSDEDRFLAQNDRIPATRDLTRAAFEKIEQKLSLAALEPDDVPSMEQWDDIDRKLDAINGRMQQSYFGSDENLPYDDYTEMLSEAQRMVANARYRVDPTPGGYRREPLLPPSAPAYLTYRTWLEPRERRLWWTQKRLGDMIAGRTPYPRGIGDATMTWEDRESPPSPQGAMDTMTNIRPLDRGLAAYSVRIDQTPKPPEELRMAIFLNSADARTRYAEYIDDHDDYKRALLVLEFTQSVVAGLLDHARRAIDPAGTVSLNVPHQDPDKEKLRLRMVGFQHHFHRRYDELGLIFPSEISELVGQIRVGEQDILLSRLKVPADVTPLSAEEQRAARERRIKEVAPRLGSTADRLSRIPELRLGSGGEKVTGILRLTDPPAPGSSRPLDSPATKTGNALVGDLRAGSYEFSRAPGIYPTGRGVAMIAHPTRIVLPLNDAAIAALGTTDEKQVRTERLAPVTLDEVQP